MAEFSDQYSHTYDYRDCREDPVLKGRCYRGLSRSLKQWGVPICLHPSIYTNVDMLNMCIHISIWKRGLEPGILPQPRHSTRSREATPST